MYSNFDSIQQTANDFTKLHFKSASNDHLSQKFDPITNDKNTWNKTSSEQFKESVKSSDVKTQEQKVKAKEDPKSQHTKQKENAQNTNKTDDSKQFQESTNKDDTTEETKNKKTFSTESTVENLLLIQNTSPPSETSLVSSANIDKNAINPETNINEKTLLNEEIDSFSIDSDVSHKAENSQLSSFEDYIEENSENILDSNETPEQHITEISDGKALTQHSTNAGMQQQKQNTQDFDYEDTVDMSNYSSSHSEEVENSNTPTTEKDSNTQNFNIEPHNPQKVNTQKSGDSINATNYTTETNQNTNMNRINDNHKFVDNIMKKSILNQTQSNIIEGISKGKNSFEFQLKPKDLGTIKLSIDFIQNKGIKINIEASTNTAIEALRQETATIENTVKELGFELNNGSLTFSFKEQTRDQNDSQYNSFQQHADNYSGDFAKLYETTKQQINIVTNSSVNTLV